VWVAGTDGETRMEVFTPDYLLRGPGPVITSAPASVAYGQGFPISLLEPADISSTCFIRLSAVTHAYNMSQRYVSLDFTQTDVAGLDVTAPNDPTLASPGHYMLFVMDAAGVPAAAPIIQLVYV
jgi:galactose oxidase